MAEGHGIVQNPIRQLEKLGPRPAKLKRYQREAAERVARFEAQRAQEDSMALTMQVQDLNPGPKETKLQFTPKSTTIPERPAKSVVQRVQRPQDVEEQGPDLLAELAAEFAPPSEPTGEAASSPTPPAGDADVDISNILNRYKGTTEEILQQLAKSYGHSEKRQRQLEQEKQLLMRQEPAPQPYQAPATQQIQVAPQFDYKKWGDTFLDRPDERVKELEQHIAARTEQKMLEVAGPLYEEAIDNRLFRKFGDIVTEDNLDLIKAMAQSEPGANRWEKTVNAVRKYHTAMPSTTTKPNAEVAGMQQAVQTPAPQARASGEKKMWKESDIQATLQKKIRTGEYRRDPRWRTLIDTAYREGRVLRGQ